MPLSSDSEDEDDQEQENETRRVDETHGQNGMSDFLSDGPTGSLIDTIPSGLLRPSRT